MSRDDLIKAVLLPSIPPSAKDIVRLAFETNWCVGVVDASARTPQSLVSDTASRTLHATAALHGTIAAFWSGSGLLARAGGS